MAAQQKQLLLGMCSATRVLFSQEQVKAHLRGMWEVIKESTWEKHHVEGIPNLLEALAGDIRKKFKKVT